MRKQDTATTNAGQQQTIRDWNPEIICITVAAIVVFIMSAGNPDIIDGLVSLMMKGR